MASFPSQPTVHDTASAPGGAERPSFEALPPAPMDSTAASLLPTLFAPLDTLAESLEGIDSGPPGYDLLGRLGHGAMGEVLLARDRRLERLVALKMIRSDVAGPQWRERFLAEARTVAQLRHPNIVQIYEV